MNEENNILKSPPAFRKRFFLLIGTAIFGAVGIFSRSSVSLPNLPFDIVLSVPLLWFSLASVGLLFFMGTHIRETNLGTKLVKTLPISGPVILWASSIMVSWFFLLALLQIYITLANLYA